MISQEDRKFLPVNFEKRLFEKTGIKILDEPEALDCIIWALKRYSGLNPHYIELAEEHGIHYEPAVNCENVDGLNRMAALESRKAYQSKQERIGHLESSIESILGLGSNKPTEDHREPITYNGTLNYYEPDVARALETFIAKRSGLLKEDLVEIIFRNDRPKRNELQARRRLWKMLCMIGAVYLGIKNTVTTNEAQGTVGGRMLNFVTLTSERVVPKHQNTPGKFREFHRAKRKKIHKWINSRQFILEWVERHLEQERQISALVGPSLTELCYSDIGNSSQSSIFQRDSFFATVDEYNKSVLSPSNDSLSKFVAEERQRWASTGLQDFHSIL